MLTWKVPLDHNTELAPSGNVSVKTWNWYNGLMVGLDNTNGSSTELLPQREFQLQRLSSKNLWRR